MPIERPELVTNSGEYRGVRTLHFPYAATEDVRLWGGIAWPTIVGQPGAERVEGFACVAAENISTRIITVYEQTRWVSIEPEVAPNRSAVKRGLANYLQDWYALYRVSTYSTICQRDSERETWEPQVRHCRMIQPQPGLRIEHFDIDDAFAEIMTRAQAGQFFHSAGQPLDVAIQAAKTDRSQVQPAVMAVAAAMRGLRGLGITLVPMTAAERNRPGEWMRVFGRAAT